MPLPLCKTMRIFIHNSQRRFKIAAAALKRLAVALARLAQTRQPDEPPWREVTVHLLDDEGIAPVNQAILSHSGATDVITQRYEPFPDEPEGLIGNCLSTSSARPLPRPDGRAGLPTASSRSISPTAAII